MGRLQHLLVAIVGRKCDLAIPVQPTAAFKGGNAVTLKKRSHATGKALHHLLLALYHFGNIRTDFADVDSEIRKIMLGFMELV